MLLQRFPYLAQIPPDAPQGVDSPLPPPPPVDWSKLGELIPTHSSEENDGGEIYPADDDVTCTWHDVALSIAAELMAKIREDVHENLGYTMSAVCFALVSQSHIHLYILIRGYPETSFLPRSAYVDQPAAIHLTIYIYC